MADFDPQDILNTAPAAPAGTDFDPADVIKPPAPVSQKQAIAPDFDNSDVIRQSSSGIVKKTGEVLTDDELAQLADKHQIDPEELKKLAPYYGASVMPHSVSETAAVAGRTAAGIVGRGLGLGLPQYLYKKSQDPNIRAALDELRNIGEEQAPLASKIAEGVMIPGGGAESALSKTVAGRLGTAAGIGAATGGLNSNEGQEVQGMKHGAVLGSVLGAGAEVLPSVVNGVSAIKNKLMGKVTPTEEVLLRQSKLAQVDIDSAAQKEAQHTQDADQVIEDSIRFKTEPHPEEFEKIADQYLPERAQEALETSKDPIQDLRDYGKKIWEDNLSDFAEKLTGEKPANAQDAIESLHASQAGEGGDITLMKKFKNFMDEQYAERAIKSGDLEIQGTGKFSERASNFFSTKEPVLRAIDERAETHSEQILEDANVAINKKTLAKQYFDGQVKQIIESVDKSALTPEAKVRIYEARDRGNVGSLTSQEQEAADKIAKQFENVRQFANGVESESGGVKLPSGTSPMSIPKLEGGGYIFKSMKEPAELIRSIQQKERLALDEVSEALGRKVESFSEISPEEFRKVTELPETQELLWPAKTLEGGEILTGKALDNRLGRLYGKEGRMGLESTSKAAMQRTGEIPDYLLEKDPYKLLGKYTDNTLNHLYLREHLEKLATQANILEKAGDKYGSEYVRNVIRDIRGTRPNSLPAEYQQRKAQAFVALDRMADQFGRDSVTGKVILSAKNVPNILQGLSHGVYQTMQWNVRSFIQNQLQTITKTWPELGLQYGTINLMKSGTKALLNRGKYIAEAEKMGLLQPQYTDGIEKALQEGIRKSSLYKMTDRALETNAKLGMAMHQFGEQNNRAIAVAAAEQMAEDIASGSNLAGQSLRNFPMPLQKQILGNIQDIQSNKEALAKYLIGQTQYFYSKASMSEFGSVLGPMFTPFTKWPTATYGDILYELRSKNLGPAAMRIGAKYIAPWLLLDGIQHILIGSPEDQSDFQKLIAGSHGLTQASPIGTIESIGTGDMFAPPLVKAVINGIVVPAWKGDTDKMERGADAIFEAYTPGAGTYRLFTKDIPIYLDRIQKGK